MITIDSIQLWFSVTWVCIASLAIGYALGRGSYRIK